MVAYVWSDSLVNLTVSYHYEKTFGTMSGTSRVRRSAILRMDALPGRAGREARQSGIATPLMRTCGI
jgi:hypothetical protein